MKRKKIRKGTHGVAEKLNVMIPGGNLPIEIKVIALFTVTGGMSIMGGIFGDVIRPNGTHLPTYLIRLIVGISMIAVAYGIVTRKKWSLWLYGLIVVVGLYINFVAALIPLAALVYLIVKRDLFV